MCAGSKLSVCGVCVAVGLILVGMVTLHTHHPGLQSIVASGHSVPGHSMRCSSSLAPVDNVADWTAPEIPADMVGLDQDDPGLMEYICQVWLLPPTTQPYRLKQPDREHFSQRFQSEIVDAILQGRRDGFYIEIGAADGEEYSNSLFFERTRGWTGLLMETMPKFLKGLFHTRRHAYIVPACVSSQRISTQLRYVNMGMGGGIVEAMEEVHMRRFAKKMSGYQQEVMTCLPLYSILHAIGVTHVDYFSLDVEGAELDVLKTLPLDKITVDVFSIEYVIGNTGNNEATRMKLAAIQDYLVTQHGYIVASISPTDDVILRHRHLY